MPEREASACGRLSRCRRSQDEAHDLLDPPETGLSQECMAQRSAAKRVYPTVDGEQGDQARSDASEMVLGKDRGSERRRSRVCHGDEWFGRRPTQSNSGRWRRIITVSPLRPDGTVRRPLVAGVQAGSKASWGLSAACRGRTGRRRLLPCAARTPTVLRGAPRWMRRTHRASPAFHRRSTIP